MRVCKRGCVRVKEGERLKRVQDWVKERECSHPSVAQKCVRERDEREKREIK